jgi:hypothetical protein
MSKLPELQERHFLWILNGAFEHFAEKVADYEREIIRHNEFRKDAHYNPRAITLGKSRDEEIQRINEYLAQYRLICEWLKITHSDVSEKLGREDSIGLADFIRERHGLEPAKKPSRKKTK